MKINYLPKILVVCLLLAVASPSVANTGPKVSAVETAEARAVQLENRLEQIKGMDKSELSSSEKKALRREVRQIKKELAAVSGGVYLSIGAILLIALLLILLL